MAKQKKKRYLSRKQSWILLVFLLPLILSSLVLYFIFGNLLDAFEKMLQLRGNPSKTADAIASLSYVGSILLALYSIITTAIFSYLVWKVSIGSFQVSKELKSLEENRDKEGVREQALIVYYDLQRGFSYLRDLYISTVNKGISPTPKRLFFSSEWIKNVATLRNGLSNEDLNIVYQMYNDFFTLQSLLENPLDNSTDQNDEMSRVIKGMSERYFADFFPLPALDQYTTSSADDFLEINFYITLQKIYLLTFPENQVKKQKTEMTSCDVMINNVRFYSVRSGELWDGEGILYTINGYKKADGHFTKGLFRTGKVYGYFDNVSKHYLIKYETTGPERTIIEGELIDSHGTEQERYYFNGQFQDGVIFTGITTEYHSNGSVSFRGNVESGIREGRGTTYMEDGKILFQGLYEQGERSQGTIYKKGKEHFVGEFRDGRPWNGKVTDYDFYREKVKNFTGKIQEGKPNTGTGIRFKRNEFGLGLDDVIHQENWEPDDSMLEQQDNYYQEWINEETREKYSDWKDYIKVDWKEGEALEREDIEENLTVYYSEYNRRKNN
ncbi:hypothetical protein KY492_00505 [Brevibacterium sp. PAMC21349]|nr:hypothetical protein KY492_00505 [Brevibacterium sp. PAMC21349]